FLSTAPRSHACSLLPGRLHYSKPCRSEKLQKRHQRLPALDTPRKTAVTAASDSQIALFWLAPCGYTLRCLRPKSFPTLPPMAEKSSRPRFSDQIPMPKTDPDEGPHEI